MSPQRYAELSAKLAELRSQTALVSQELAREYCLLAGCCAEEASVILAEAIGHFDRRAADLDAGTNFCSAVTSARERQQSVPEAPTTSSPRGLTAAEHNAFPKGRW